MQAILIWEIIFKMLQRISKSEIKPLQIYLDSSDYSHMSNPKSPLFGKYQKIKDELKYFIDNNYIEVRFSMIHVLEMMHTEEGYKDAALKRVDAMVDLSGKKVMVDLLTLEYLDAKFLINNYFNKGNVFKFPNYAYDDNGVWLSVIGDSFVGLKKILVEELKKSLKKTGYQRHERRKVRSMMTNKHGVNKEILVLMKTESKRVMQDLQTRIPLTDRIYKENMFLKLFTKEITERELISELERGVMNPANFVGYHIDRDFSELRLRAEAIIKVPASVKENTEATREKIYELVNCAGNPESMAFYAKKLRCIKLDDLVISSMRQSRLKRMFDEYRKRDKNPNVSSKNWDEIVVKSDFGKIPSIDSHIGILKNYIISSAMLNGRDYKFSKMKNSDWGDIMHARFLPYVDVFRSDSGFSKHISEIASKYNTIVVNKIEDLVPSIKKLLL